MPENEYSRPATLDDLKKVIQSLNENRAEYILIGGYALFSHGYHRATEDIDLLVPDNSTSSKPIINALLVLADKESANIDSAWFDEGENIILADEVVVDLEGVWVKTLSLEGLIKTKQSERDKDMMDCVGSGN